MTASPNPEEPGPASFDLCSLVRRLSSELARGLELEPLPLAPHFARREGTYRGSALVLETRAFRGARIAYGRSVTLEGESIAIGNLLYVSEPSFGVPTLGADFVLLRGELMSAIDLSPMHGDASERDRQLEPLRIRRQRHAPLPEAGRLPEFCARWFSPYALFTRHDCTHFSALENAVTDFTSAFVETARAATADSARNARVRAEQIAYARAHREDDKGLNLLGKAFGRQWSAQFLEIVMFPDQFARTEHGT